MPITRNFLLHVDKELNGKEKNELNKFLSSHPELEEELTLLHQTVLPVEQIKFADRAALYRTERKERRIIPLNWKAFAVAAALIVLIVLVWLSVPSGKQQQVALINKPSVQHKKEENIVAPKTVIVNEPNKNLILANKIKLPEEGIKDQRSVITKNNVANDNKISSAPFVIPNSNTAQTQIAPVDNDLAATPQSVQQQTSPEYPQTLVNNSQNVYTSNTSNNNIAQPAVYRELNTSDENNKDFYVGSLDINKNKVRGLLKKAGRLFGGKAKDDAKDIKVANLDINTQSL